MPSDAILESPTRQRLSLPAQRFRAHTGPINLGEWLARRGRYAGCLCEWLDGQLAEKPMGLAESRVALRLGVRIGIYLDTHPLGWLSGADGPFAFTADDCFLPDLAFVPRTPGTPPASLPTLVAEVLSDSNTAAEMAYKRAVYFAAGVQLVWEIDIQLRTVSVFTQPTAPPMILNRTHTLEGGTVLPGFRVALVDLFAVLEVD